MILPRGEMRKFVKTTIGLIIILVIINPFIKLVQGDIDIEKELLKNIDNKYSYRENDLSEFTLHQDELIEEMYVEEIKTEIEDHLKKKTNYMLIEGDIEIDKNKDGENYGGIEKVILLLGEESNESYIDTDNEKIKSIRVDVKVSDISNDKKIVERKEISVNTKDIENVKNVISTKFEIDKDKISIDVETKD